MHNHSIPTFIYFCQVDKMQKSILSTILCALYLLFLFPPPVDGKVSFSRHSSLSSRLGNIDHSSTLLFIEALSSSTYINGLEKELIASHFDLTPVIYYSLNESKLHVQKSLNRPHLFKTANSIFTVVSIGENIKIGSTANNLKRILIPVLRPMVLKDEEKVVFNFHHPDIPRYAKVLKSDFGKKLKYKIATSLFPLKSELRSDIELSYSSCEFCPDTEHIQSFESDPSKWDWPDFEQNFAGRAIRITTSSYCTPRLNYKLGSDGKYYLENGLLIYTLTYMKQKLNFTMELKLSPGTGIKLPNGTWTGVMSDVLNGDADIGMCTAETYERSVEVGFAPAVVTERVSFVSRTPRQVFVWEAVFWPFTPIVWAVLIFFIFLSVIMVRLSSHVLSTPDKERWKSDEVFEFICKVLLASCRQYPKKLPKTFKVYIAVWLICGITFTTAYLSKLTGFLTFPVLEKIPQNAEELVDSDYKWGLAYFGGALYSLIKASEVKSYQRVFAGMELHTDMIKCLNRTLDSKYICISYDTVPKLYLNKRIDLQPGDSPFVVQQTPFLSLPVGIAMEKRAVFSPNIKEAIVSSDAAGLIPVWERMDIRHVRKGIFDTEMKKHGQIKKKQHASIQTQTLITSRHMDGAYTLFAVGVIIAVTVFIFEFMIKYAIFDKIWNIFALMLHVRIFNNT
jgi:hypothetical protein